MVVTPITGRWDELFAERTRGDVGEGIAFVLGFLGRADLISFAGGFPDPLTFPRDQAAALLAEFAESGESTAFQYAPTRGLAGTLDAVAGRLESGAGPAPGRRGAGDHERRDRGARARRQVVPRPWRSRRRGGADVPGRDHGFPGLRGRDRRRPAGRRTASRWTSSSGGSTRGLRPKLLYTIPDHQNPAGVSLSLERRELLVELARRHGFLIVEDVAYRELTFGDESLPSLWSLAPDVVVQAGTTSKTFLPGVRLGWAAGPAEICAKLVSAKQNTDQCSGALGQRMLEEYIRRGWIDEQLVASRALYRRKGERLLAALDRSMPAGASWTRAAGGFYSWLTIPGCDTTALTGRAAEAGVGIVPGALFYADGRGGENVRLSFSMVDESLIDEGIDRLASLLP